MLSLSHPHIRKPEDTIGHSPGLEDKISSLSGSGSSALFVFHITTFNCKKSSRKLDLNEAFGAGGTRSTQ